MQTDIFGNRATARYEIISCSRRTDIPGFYLPWAIKQMTREFVDVPAPYSDQKTRVSLSPNDAKIWVWWSKNYGHLIENSENPVFEKYNHYFQFTINTESPLEPNVPSLESRLTQVTTLAKLFSIDQIYWRFDPIVFWKRNGTEYNNLGQFDQIARHLADLGATEMAFAFAFPYQKTVKRMRTQGFELSDPPLDEKVKTLTTIANTCHDLGIVMKGCCQPELLTVRNVQQSRCLDGEKFNRIFGLNLNVVKDKRQREHCGCTTSMDIGDYNFKCGHSCIYCYANPKDGL